TEEAVLIMWRPAGQWSMDAISGGAGIGNVCRCPGFCQRLWPRPRFPTVRYKDDALMHIGALRARARGTISTR
uniref:hypothetical protein n=1 Tax=Escherichia coli TaxID=562 RepID=UPI00227DB3B8